jgi:hypothetical protein
VFRLLLWAIAAIFRPRTRLIAENLCLRQQLLVLQRRYPRPRLINADRRFWIPANRWFGDRDRPLRIATGDGLEVAATDQASAHAFPVISGQCHRRALGEIGAN